jgi:Carbon-nitrogen hydrolase
MSGSRLGIGGVVGTAVLHKNPGRTDYNGHTRKTEMPTKVAVIQKPPVLLHRKSTIESALASIEEAVRAGATLLVFPEAFVPGYPTWMQRSPGFLSLGFKKTDEMAAIAVGSLISGGGPANGMSSCWRGPIIGRR